MNELLSSSKPHPSIFVRDAEVWVQFNEQNQNIWIENSSISERWTLTHDHVITGVPYHEWIVSLQPGQCIDIVPVGNDEWAVRTYQIKDRFNGDEQTIPRFPVVNNVHDIGLVLRFMLGDSQLAGGRLLYQTSRKMSAEQILAEANPQRIAEQRQEFQRICSSVR